MPRPLSLLHTSSSRGGGHYTRKKKMRMIVMRKILSASRKTYMKTMSYVNNFLGTAIIKTSSSSFVYKEKNNTMLSFKIMRGSIP